MNLKKNQQEKSIKIQLQIIKLKKIKNNNKKSSGARALEHSTHLRPTFLFFYGIDDL